MSVSDIVERVDVIFIWFGIIHKSSQHQVIRLQPIMAQHIQNCEIGRHTLKIALIKTFIVVECKGLLEK